MLAFFSPPVILSGLLFILILRTKTLRVFARLIIIANNRELSRKKIEKVWKWRIMGARLWRARGKGGGVRVQICRTFRWAQKQVSSPWQKFIRTPPPFPLAKPVDRLAKNVMAKITVCPVMDRFCSAFGSECGGCCHGFCCCSCCNYRCIRSRSRFFPLCGLLSFSRSLLPWRLRSMLLL